MAKTKLLKYFFVKKKKNEKNSKMYTAVKTHKTNRFVYGTSIKGIKNCK